MDDPMKHETSTRCRASRSVKQSNKEMVNYFFHRKLAQAIADLHSVDLDRLTLFDERGNIIKANGKVYFLQHTCSDKILSRAPDKVEGDEKNKRYVLSMDK